MTANTPVNRTLGGTLLITGTCVGAAMLALPISTAPAGYYPSLVLLGVCWFLMFLSGLFILEVNLSLPEQASFVSMANKTLGLPAAVLCWLSYLLLLYSLLAAYLSGGGDLVVQAAQLTTLGKHMPGWFGSLPWVLVIGLMIYWGVRRVDYLNRVLVVGLSLAFFSLVAMITPHVDVHQFDASHYQHLWAALPVVITAFGYQVVIPSVRTYLKSNKKQLTKAIFFGSFLSLMVYVIWETDVFGLIPLGGANGLTAILHSGHPAADLPRTMTKLLHNDWVALEARAFIFFALASSFVGIALSLFDFLADACRIPKTHSGRVLLLVMTFVPPLAYTYWYPAGFILALSYAGIFVAVLNAMLPALMVWGARRKGLSKDYRAPGGIFSVLLVLGFSIAVILAALSK